MKAKKLMGMMAFASACVSLSAFANTTNGWFGVTVANSDVALSNISTNGVGTVADSKINLENIEQNSSLEFTPDASFADTNRTDDIYVIGANVVLTPCSTNDFRDVDVTGAKAGVVAGIDDHDVTNYYGYANGVWIKLEESTVEAPGKETEFYIVLNYRDDKASFIIVENEGEKWYGPYDMSTGEASALANIKVWGTGSISCVTGEFEVAEAEYNSKRYGSVAEAMAVVKEAAGSGTPDYSAIAVVNDQGTPVPGTTVDSNGRQNWENKAMGIDSDEQVGLTKASEKQNENKITLAANLDKKEDGVVVKFYVYSGDEEIGGPYDEDNIQIPMGVEGSATYRIVPVVQTTK